MAQTGGSYAVPNPKSTWRSKKLWDDEYLKRTRENPSFKSPEPNRYYPSLALTKRTVALTLTLEFSVDLILSLTLTLTLIR